MYTLYYKSTCPFCQKVLAFIKENNITVDLKDIMDQEHADALIAKGGKQQVPFLIDSENDTSMYESDDIIAYLTSKMNA